MRLDCAPERIIKELAGCGKYRSSDLSAMFPLLRKALKV
jgi:hypothetical protein